MTTDREITASLPPPVSLIRFNCLTFQSNPRDGCSTLKHPADDSCHFLPLDDNRTQREGRVHGRGEDRRRRYSRSVRRQSVTCCRSASLCDCRQGSASPVARAADGDTQPLAHRCHCKAWHASTSIHTFSMQPIAVTSSTKKERKR